MVVALAITADGTKKPVGLWDGSTENKTVVRALLADLVERGLAFDDGLLVVLDGAKALAAACASVRHQGAHPKMYLAQAPQPTVATGAGRGFEYASGLFIPETGRPAHRARAPILRASLRPRS